MLLRFGKEVGASLFAHFYNFKTYEYELLPLLTTMKGGIII